MQQDIVLQLEKRKRDLQNMVEDTLAERREEMLEVLMNKVGRELKQEVEIYAQATNDAMDSIGGDMKCQLYVHNERMLRKEVSLHLQAKMSEEQEKKGEKKEDGKQCTMQKLKNCV